MNRPAPSACNCALARRASTPRETVRTRAARIVVSSAPAKGTERGPGQQATAAHGLRPEKAIPDREYSDDQQPETLLHDTDQDAARAAGEPDECEQYRDVSMGAAQFALKRHQWRSVTGEGCVGACIAILAPRKDDPGTG